MSNRKERRAQAQTFSGVSFKQPSRDAPSHKTLIDIASERQLLDDRGIAQTPSIVTTRINADGTCSQLDALDASRREDDGRQAVWLDVLLYTISLTMLHFTLTVLVHHQYATDPPSLVSLLYGSTIATPTPLILLILVALLHPQSSHIAVQIFFAALSVIAGIWLVKASNEEPYLAVMKKSPPLGTIWVWAVVESRWEVAAVCVGGVGVWAWLMGYGFR